MANNCRLIKADDLYQRTFICEEPGDFRKEIENAPTVDAVEVVHGRWKKASETMPIYRCSACKERNLFKNGDNVLSNYCPNCGAKMDGGNDNAG